MIEFHPVHAMGNLRSLMALLTAATGREQTVKSIYLYVTGSQRYLVLVELRE
jgi:hypothetical protein